MKERRVPLIIELPLLGIGISWAIFRGTEEGIRIWVERGSRQVQVKRHLFITRIVRGSVSLGSNLRYKTLL